MNDGEARKQIQQMCAFIDQEAKEKVAEIRLKTEQERDKQLSLLSVQGRQSIKDQYDQMVKDLNVKKRIMKAKASQSELVRKMNSREELLSNMLTTAQNNLVGFSKSAEYEKLLERLLVQGLVTLMEENVKIKCRECDLKLCTKLTRVAEKAYTKLMKEDCGRDVKITTRLDTNYLPDNGAGGVILLGASNRIVCDNTLESRLKIVFQDLQPVVRQMLFPNPNVSSE